MAEAHLVLSLRTTRADAARVLLGRFSVLLVHVA